MKGVAEQIVGPEPRATTFALSLVRRSLLRNAAARSTQTLCFFPIDNDACSLGNKSGRMANSGLFWIRAFDEGLPLIVGLPLMWLVLDMISLRQMLLFMAAYLVIVPFGALVEWWKNEGAYFSAKLDRVESLKNK